MSEEQETKEKVDAIPVDQITKKWEDAQRMIGKQSAEVGEKNKRIEELEAKLKEIEEAKAQEATPKEPPQADPKETTVLNTKVTIDWEREKLNLLKKLSDEDLNKLDEGYDSLSPEARKTIKDSDELQVESIKQFMIDNGLDKPTSFRDIIGVTTQVKKTKTAAEVVKELWGDEQSKRTNGLPVVSKNGAVSKAGQDAVVTPIAGSPRELPDGRLFAKLQELTKAKNGS